jgi:hypothetical protein
MVNNRNSNPPARTPNVQPRQTARAYIRQDLWDAAINRSRRFVWDAARGVARAPEPNDTLPTFPPVDREALQASRVAFFEDISLDLHGQDLVLATRWRDSKLKTSELPKFIHNKWNKELTRVVQRHIERFFASQKQAIEIDTADDQSGDQTDSNSEPTSNKSTIFDENVSAARDAGNFFVVGELLLRKLALSRDDRDGQIFAQAVVAWASAKGPLFEPKTLGELIAQVGSIPEPSLSMSLINVIYRLRKSSIEPPADLGDLAFKLKESISSLYELDDRRSPIDSCNAAASGLENKLTELEGAASRFVRTTLTTARNASIELIRASRALYEILIPAECEFIRDLEMVLGPSFRKCCEAYERNDDMQVIRRAPEMLENVNGCFLSSKDAQTYSFTWNTVVRPILTHLSTLLEEAQSRGEVALAPVLALRNPSTKAHLREAGQDIYLSFSLYNSGRGHAFYVSMSTHDGGLANLSLVEPSSPFDVAPGSEQLVRVRLTLTAPTNEAVIDVVWLCQTTRGTDASFKDRVVIKQQETEPNWDALVADPPYSLNPIRNRERLFGRDAVLRTLTLAAMSGASTFVWGQKRIGKTSLLQVFASQLATRSNAVCLTLRMGEIGALHEGEIGHLIARRIVEKSRLPVAIPSEAEFGAGMGRLVRFAEQLLEQSSLHKFVVIIDEFDDIDARFYLGERGRQFVKALRSISEAGLTFFFVGSERMEAIYHAHQADLNKWTNVHLDRITSRTECKSLIESPVKSAIEFSQEAIDFIIDYTDGNPFYINNFCFYVFDRCLQEHRTFVDGSDINAVRQHLLRALGESNFSQFWQDNPILDDKERLRAESEICIALSCISILGGRYEFVEDLITAQEGLPLAQNDYATENEIRRACERLMGRNIIKRREADNQFAIGPQIFSEWLRENAIGKLLPNWTKYQAIRRSESDQSQVSVLIDKASEATGFVIPEDELLAVSQKLVYCGRQKDVAEIRSWLRQFDDDSRIEVAFQLLKRLAEKGFINEGARSLAYSKIEEMVKARRIEIGQKVWKVERGRLDNLCLAYVDSEIKSGAATARELRNILRPGKSGPAEEMGTWMERHFVDDPMLVIVDDFAGTGETLVKGIQRCEKRIEKDVWRKYLDDGRISLFVMYSFPEALDNIRSKCHGVNVVGSTVLGDELRSCGEEAGIFDDDGDRRFARDIVLPARP